MKFHQSLPAGSNGLELNDLGLLNRLERCFGLELARFDLYLFNRGSNPCPNF